MKALIWLEMGGRGGEEKEKDFFFIPIIESFDL